jgi:hypothetical protein
MPFFYGGRSGMPLSVDGWLGRRNQGRITAMRKVAMSMGLAGTGLILGAIVWLGATPARLGAG